MTEARTDEDGEHAVNEKIARVAFFTATAHDLPAKQLVAAQKNDDENQTIIPELPRAEVEQCGIDVPGKFGHGKAFFGDVVPMSSQ
jgi:hypothetical protein